MNDPSAFQGYCISKRKRYGIIGATPSVVTIYSQANAAILKAFTGLVRRPSRATSYPCSMLAVYTGYWWLAIRFLAMELDYRLS